MRKRYLLLVTVALLALGAIAAAWPHNPPPDNFGFQLVYMADGVFDPSTPSPVGDLVDWFHKDVMGRSDADIAAEREKARVFFEEQFGIDVATEDVIPFGQDPRTDYRAYKITGYNVPPEGWLVRDGGFRMAIEEGTVLHGRFGGEDGFVMPGDGFVVFGEYNIDVTAPGLGNDPENIIIHYQSASPIVPGQLDLSFRCELSSDSFDDHGGGLAQGISAPVTLDDGTRINNIRNILTFPGLGFEGEALLQQ